MKSLREWRQINEFAGTMPTGALAPPIEGNDEPTEDDWKFYDQQIFGRLGRLLTMLTKEIENKKLTNPRKGFIVQEVMDALGLDVPMVARITSKIKQGMARRKAELAQQQSQQPQMQQQPQTSGNVGFSG